MPKGEYDTPGPFYVDDNRIFRRKPLALAQGTLWITLDEAEREELVGLLNKGTHFARLLEAVSTFVSRYEDGNPYVAPLRAAIAECEGQP